jgi:hypothetical protein
VFSRLRDTIEDLRRSLEPKENALEALQLSVAEKEQVEIIPLLHCGFVSSCSTTNSAHVHPYHQVWESAAMLCYSPLTSCILAKAYYYVILSFPWTSTMFLKMVSYTDRESPFFNPLMSVLGIKSFLSNFK